MLRVLIADDHAIVRKGLIDRQGYFDGRLGAALTRLLRSVSQA